MSETHGRKRRRRNTRLVENSERQKGREIGATGDLHE